jgi:hypothetical protein
MDWKLQSTHWVVFADGAHLYSVFVLEFHKKDHQLLKHIQFFIYIITNWIFYITKNKSVAMFMFNSHPHPDSIEKDGY